MSQTCTTELHGQDLQRAGMRGAAHVNAFCVVAKMAEIGRLWHGLSSLPEWCEDHKHWVAMHSRDKVMQ